MASIWKRIKEKASHDKHFKLTSSSLLVLDDRIGRSGVWIYTLTETDSPKSNVISTGSPIRLVNDALELIPTDTTEFTVKKRSQYVAL